MSYATDVTDSEWEVITTVLADKRRRTHSLRAHWNAIMYLVKTGCQWRMLPETFPPWSSVSYYYRQWRDRGIIEELHAALRLRVRQKAGRAASPAVAIADSQSVKTVYRGAERGFDGGKRIKGRKRHLVVDTLGLVLAVVVTAANVQDKTGLPLVLRRLRDRFARLRRIDVDGGYRSGPLAAWVRRVIGCQMRVVRRSDTAASFTVLPNRWVVERTFGWFTAYRRLSKDYEYRTDTSETMIYLAMIRLMLKRLH